MQSKATANRDCNTMPAFEGAKAPKCVTEAWDLRVSCHYPADEFIHYLGRPPRA
jgi:hypothetical protein